MQKRILVLYLPVIERGVLQFLRDLKDEIQSIFIFAQDVLKSVSHEETRLIISLEREDAVHFLEALGFSQVRILKMRDISDVIGKPLMFVDDAVSRSFARRYLPKNADVLWQKVFLRWDRENVYESHPELECHMEKSPIHVLLMQCAEDEGQKSLDWWRQVGAILVSKDNEVILGAHNQGLPDEYVLYREGSMRDFIKPGMRPDVSNTIHAEQYLIADAARKGIATRGMSLYVTHFPCSICAKLIARSGIKACYFSRGSSTVEGKKDLDDMDVSLFYIPLGYGKKRKK